MEKPAHSEANQSTLLETTGTLEEGLIVNTTLPSMDPEVQAQTGPQACKQIYQLQAQKLHSNTGL